jgi:hypothetical protein
VAGFCKHVVRFMARPRSEQAKREHKVADIHPSHKRDSNLRTLEFD